jgi:two-component system nitrate/nitrite response regulator NarL
LLRHEDGHRDAATTLSPRELDVLRIVTAGWSNKEIADKLGISEGTVKAHLHHVYEKLGVRGRLELTLYARDRGLLSPFPHDAAPKRGVSL